MEEDTIHEGHPFEWIDLNYGYPQYQDHNVNVVENLGLNQHNDYDLKYIRDSFRSDLKPDAFHQTILTVEANQKEKLQAEESFQIENEWIQIVNRFPFEFVYMLSPTGLFLRVSDNSKEIVGYRPDQLVGLNITNFIHLNELSSFYDQLNQVVSLHGNASFRHLFCTSNSYLQLEASYSSCSSRYVPQTKCILCHAKKVGDQQETPNKFEIQGHKKFISRLTLDGVSEFDFYLFIYLFIIFFIFSFLFFLLFFKKKQFSYRLFHILHLLFKVFLDIHLKRC